MYQRLRLESPWMLLILHSGVCNEDIVWDVLSKQAPDDVMVANGTQGDTTSGANRRKPWEQDVLLGMLLSCYAVLSW